MGMNYILLLVLASPLYAGGDAFHFDPQTATCINSAGAAGHNPEYGSCPDKKCPYECSDLSWDRPERTVEELQPTIDIPKINGKVNMRGAWLRGATQQSVFSRIFEGPADLRGALMEGADLRGLDFKGSDLTGAKYDSTTKLPFAPSEAEKRGMIRVDVINTQMPGPLKDSAPAMTGRAPVTKEIQAALAEVDYKRKHRWPSKEIQISRNPENFVAQVGARCLSTPESSVENYVHSIVVMDNPKCTSEIVELAKVWAAEPFYAVYVRGTEARKALRAKIHDQFGPLGPEQLSPVGKTTHCACLAFKGIKAADVAKYLNPVRK